jgi:hypothetical protein
VSTLYVQNASSVVTDAQAQSMTRAVGYQIRWQFCPAWGYTPTNLLFVDKHAKLPAGSQVIAILDDSDQAGALGYHSLDDHDVAYGRVFAKPSLDNGSQVFSGEYAVSATFSHECLEFLADVNVNCWAAAGEQQDGSPVLFAWEVADPCEGDSYTVRDMRTDVAVSNFVLPAYFDSGNTKGPWDYLRRLKGPFTIGQGGYAVKWTAAGQQQVFSDRMPEWRRELKRGELSRGGRRAGLGVPSGVPTAGGAGVLGRMLGKLRDHDG